MNADWSSFVPDMVVATFTGLVVGGVILVAELWIRRRSQLEAAATIGPMPLLLPKPFYGTDLSIGVPTYSPLRET